MNQKVVMFNGEDVESESCVMFDGENKESCVYFVLFAFICWILL